MNQAAIETSGLTKHYGSVQALNDLDLTIESGEVFGYLGPNGAGKTTTIRLLLGFLRPTRGSAQIRGLDVQARGPEARRAVSYMPSEDALYDHMRGLEYLVAFERLSGRPAHRRDELIERLDLDVTRRIKSLSTGNRQKVGIVRALQADVPVYMLDEPTRGLDPLVQQEFGRILREYRDEGRTVLLSTHVLSEAESLADRVGILRAGSLVAVETVASLIQARVRRFTARFAGPAPPDGALPDARVLARRDSELEFELAGSMDAVVKGLARYEVVDFFTAEPTLEEIFLRYYGEEASAP